MSLGLLFPGQGVDPAPMLDRLRADPVGVDHLDRLCRHLGTTLGRLGQIAGSTDESTVQPLIITLGLAAWDVIRRAGDLPPPVVAAGYSLGELTAAAAAGAVDADTTLDLSSARAAAMTAATAAAPGPPYTMVALHGPSVDAASSLAANVGAYVAIVNGPTEVVIAGASASLDALVATCEGRGIHVRPLAVPVPSHTPLLAPAAATFWRDIAATPFAPLDPPVVSGVTGAVITNPDDVRVSLRDQIDHPINWARSMDLVAEMGTTVALDVGPGRDLLALWREHHPHLPARAVEDFATLAGAAAWLRSHLGR